MAILPSKISELLNFMDEHGIVWDTAGASIGLSDTQGAAVLAAATAARAAYNAQLAAASSARAASEAARATIRDSRGTFADALRTIKAFAEQSASPVTVYNTAKIPVPTPPSPLPPPGIPTDLRAGLEPSGAISLKWKVMSPATGAVVWTVKRKIQGEPTFSSVGTTGVRSFTDGTLPLNPGTVQYIIFGQRGQSIGGACSPFTVQFGTGGGGLAITAQFSEGEGKQAA